MLVQCICGFKPVFISHILMMSQQILCDSQISVWIQKARKQLLQTKQNRYCDMKNGKWLLLRFDENNLDNEFVQYNFLETNQWNK